MSNTFNELSFGKRVAELKKEMQRGSTTRDGARSRAGFVSAARVGELDGFFQVCKLDETIEETYKGRSVRRRAASSQTARSSEAAMRSREDEAAVASLAEAARFAELEAEYHSFQSDEAAVGEPVSRSASHCSRAASLTRRPRRDVGQLQRDRALHDEAEKVREAAGRQEYEWAQETYRRATRVTREREDDRIAEAARFAELEAEFHNFRPHDPIIGESSTHMNFSSADRTSGHRAHRGVTERWRDRARREENEEARDRARLVEAERDNERNRETERSRQTRPAITASAGNVAMLVSSGRSAQARRSGGSR